MPRKMEKEKSRLYELYMSTKEPGKLAISHAGGPILEEYIHTMIQLGRDVFIRGMINSIDGWMWFIPDNGSFEHDRIHLLPGHRIVLIDRGERLEGEE